MRRLAFVLGLLALALPTLAACGDDSGGDGGGGEEVDAGFDAGPFCRGAGDFCDAENPCCSGPCPTGGVCPETCSFNSQCETGCCAPDPAAGGAPTCQPVDACFDGTQDASCQLFAEAICAYARADFERPERCAGRLSFSLADIANCERDFKRGCCGPSGCDRPSFFTSNEVAACIADVANLACPPDDPMIPPAPCTGPCYFSEDACTMDCRSCVYGGFDEASGACIIGFDGPPCIFAYSGGTMPCMAPPTWRPPFTCQGIDTSTE